MGTAGVGRRRGAPAAAVFRVVLAGACWGLSAVIAKRAFDRGVPPARMAEARVAVAFVLLAAVLVWRRRDLLRPAPGSLPAMVAFGVSVAAVNGTYYFAIDRLEVGVAVSIQYTAPVLLLALAAVRGQRRPRALAWGAAGVTLLGAVLVSEAYRGGGRLSPAGLGAAAASAAAFGAYLLTAEQAGRRGSNPATTLFWGFVVAILAWTVVAPWWSWPVGRLSQPGVALAVLGVGVVGTLVPFFLAVGAVRVLAPATAGIAATVEPPFAAAFAWLLLGEHLGPVQVTGALLVVAGVALAQRDVARAPSAIAIDVAP